MESEPVWETCWREELISRAWATLAEKHAKLFVVLLQHARNPEESTAEKAALAAAELNDAITPNNYRVTLHRAQKKMASLVLEEVAFSLEQPNDSDLVFELRELGLLSYCHKILVRRGLLNP